MVRVTYIGLGPRDRAVAEFEALTPLAAELVRLQRECRWGDPDHMALGVALNALETTAFHFTGRPHFYAPVRDGAAHGAVYGSVGNGRLSDREEALSAFRALAPYMEALRKLQGRCRPYGRDYLALGVAQQGLLTAAYHFTRRSDVYGAAPCGPFQG